MTASDDPMLVLGVGNVLLRDDGVGVHVIRELLDRVERGAVILPEGTSIVDGGTVGLGLLPLVSRARAIVLVDAVDRDLPPGTIVVDGPEQLLASCAGADDLRTSSAGDPLEASGGVGDRAGLGDLLALARLLDTLPQAIALVGIQAGEIAAGLDLSVPVRAAVPAAIASIALLARRLDDLAAATDSALLARALEAVGARP